MKFIDKLEPDINKPLIIAAMQDMGNVGSIVVNFINNALNSVTFRSVKSTTPYVFDKGGYIEVPEEYWEYKYGNDIIIFGGGRGQPEQNDELNELCQDVIDVAKKYDAKFIYTVGGFHTSKQFGKHPTTYVTTTSKSLLEQIRNLDIETTPHESVITGFNGLILGYAKLNGINGMGLYGELLDPRIPQYRAAKSIIETLEKLTYQKFGSLSELDIKADAVDNQLKGNMNDDDKFSVG
jgi:proteasome assembly chaperone (PAC2) family protein|tara:strand:+ start:2488 stop:3198 length:711 start_codon:yes stop_codon:yes gene_type:complete